MIAKLDQTTPPCHTVCCAEWRCWTASNCFLNKFISNLLKDWVTRTPIFGDIGKILRCFHSNSSKTWLNCLARDGFRSTFGLACIAYSAFQWLRWCQLHWVPLRLIQERRENNCRGVWGEWTITPRSKNAQLPTILLLTVFIDRTEETTVVTCLWSNGLLYLLRSECSERAAT